VMIREGQRIQKRETGEDVELIQKEDIMEGCRTSFIELAEIVREEFNKCFAIKKKESKTSKSKKN
jgi:SpoVK/Ycf46/Vps4 family AAA+-type ATPase